MSDLKLKSILLHFLVIHVSLCFGGCVQSERDALLQFKNGLTDPSNRLADWAANGSDCCKWTGVVCHNVTSHVLELHLRTQSVEGYLGGKVSSSLLHLKHLSYLDLSFNDYGGDIIPQFLGSMQSLRYLNLSNSRFGGIIPPQLGNLSNLKYLNLESYMYNLEVQNLDWISDLSSLEFLDMSYINLQSFDWLKVMNSLPSLDELHLSNCRLSSFNPLPYLNFSSLSVLDLSFNYLASPILNALQNMTSVLRELDLSWNDFNSSIPNWFYDLTHLQLLDLSHSQLQGQISNDIGNLTSLISLDLAFNFDLQFEHGIPNSFRNFCSLRLLDLSKLKLNQEMNEILEILSSGCVSGRLESLSLGPLSGYLTDQIGYFPNLRHLSLHATDDLMIHGPIPASFKHLCSLRSLHLSGAKLNQEINGVLAIMSGCVSNVLQSLELSDCQLSGHLTDDLRFFKNLITFDISYNSISGPIPSSLGEMNSLVSLYLRHNNLNGSLPISFGNLGNLKEAYISGNRLEGEISQLHFANLTRLSQFLASGMGRAITLRVLPNWIPPLQLQYLSLGSWNIGSQIPMWLQQLKHLIYLDLSNCEISTPIPNWFWKFFPKYTHLDLSNNQIYGSFPNIIVDNYGVIDLSSNNFSGEIPYFSSKVNALDLSNNSFTGSIFDFLCYKMNEDKQMQVLNLERNLLVGEIPDCWRSWKKLEALTLSNNKFSGNIPSSIGTLSLLQTLHIRNNNLSGEIPPSIQNCIKLFIIDFSGNNLVGNLPTWIGERLVSLTILGLNANEFDGYLPKELCHSVSLHILDLAHNGLSGTIPSCFSNFTGMAIRNDSTGSFYSRGEFMESTLLRMKGKVMEYSSNLLYVRSIDLSDNNLTGEIPVEITSLTELLSLNLSKNALSGRIPTNIGDMKGLEAIDFSHNQLSGEIPESMSTLTFLGTLDLSYNNFSGRIPSGSQLQGFDSSSFEGNQLCGLPLPKNCSTDSSQGGTKENDENEIEVDEWFYISMAFGFVFGFWSVVGSLVFIKRWRHFYFRSLHQLGEKIWWNVIGRFH